MILRNRICPICNQSKESKIFAEAQFNENKLNNFAFSSRKLPEYMHFRLVQCTKCDLVYATPIPSEEELEILYKEADFDSSKESQYASITYAKLLSLIIKRLPDLNGALDIGTGDGTFLEQLLLRGFTNIVGVEPSTAPIESAKPRVRNMIEQCLFDPDKFEHESFSLVTCFQTLEHLYDPYKICKGINKLLKKGGAAYFVSHNYRSLTSRILGKKTPIFDIEHLQLFSPKSIRCLLIKCGFKEVSIIRIRNKYPLYYWIKLFPFPATMKQVLTRMLKNSKLGVFPISLPTGNIAVIGYKEV